MDRRRVVISGSGVAAIACHALFRRFGWRTFSGQPPASAGAQTVPFVALNELTWGLLRDVFGKTPPEPCGTDRRIVVNHSSAEVSTVRETRFVVPAEAVRFQEFMPLSEDAPADAHLVETADRADRKDAAAWLSSGSRVSWMRSARSLAVEAERSLVLEFVPDGWVFWMPTGARRGIVQWMLPDSAGGDDLCAELWRTTKFIRKWAVPQGAWITRALPSSARIGQGLMSRDAARCGSAAMRFDPISGDGIGASLRSSILACAAVRYMAEQPGDVSLVSRHYESRMLRAFRDHIASCSQYYSAAGLSRRWGHERQTISEAAAAAAGPHFRALFRLENLSLNAI